MHLASVFILMLGICILFLVDDGEAECKDKKKTCPALAEKGHCTHEKKGPKVSKRCKLSCNLCSADSEGAVSIGTPGIATCEDKKPEECRTMAEKGYCTVKKQRKKMSKRCKKSCNLCSQDSGDGGSKEKKKKGKKKKKGEKKKGKKKKGEKKKGKKKKKGEKKKGKKKKGEKKKGKKSKGKGGGNCKDKASNCADKVEKGHCTDEKHQKKTKKRCKKSCNLC